MRSARDADLLIAMFDSSRTLESADLDVIRLAEGRPGLAILNKRDLPAAITAADLRDRGLSLPILPFSAINLDEVATLRAELTNAISALVSPSGAPSSNDQIAISRERHRDALAIALEVVAGFAPSEVAESPRGVPADPNGGIKGKRPSKKDKLRAQAARQAH